ncbi:MAG: OmpA family protein [Cyclobacteriaceae bacterium]|nr:OmpA family protein [Cyclobacteriaceae bacterium]
MYLKRIFLVIAIILSTSISSLAQDNIQLPVPTLISHLTPAHRDILRIRSASKHNIFQRVLCFKINCRREAGWQKSQKDRRYDGYKDVPQVKQAKKINKTEAKAVVHTTEPPAIKPDTTAIKKVIAPMVDKDAPKERKFILSDVLFDVNSPALKKDFTSQLDTLVGLLKKKLTTQVFIIGHTDNTGREAYNMRLSTSRAEAVGVYLIDKGIDPTRITFEGKGSAEPIGDNTFEEGRQKNRRVEIILRD